MAQRRLEPMDIVLYDKKLWVVSTAHTMDSQCRQVVNLAGYKRRDYVKDIEAYRCKIVHDEQDRERKEVMPGMYLYPNSDFKQALKDK